MMPAVSGGNGLPMIPPTGMAIAALTVMLWLIWSDTIRKVRAPAVLYAVRIALFVIVAGILVPLLVDSDDACSGRGAGRSGRCRVLCAAAGAAGLKTGPDEDRLAYVKVVDRTKREIAGPSTRPVHSFRSARWPTLTGP
jgi:hypothetical protein